jgi:AraC family transcriptional regulator, positive regulator of tynA and feaB
VSVGIVLSTESVAPEQRLDYWRTTIRERFGLKYEIEPLGAQPFAMRLTAIRLGPVSIMEVSGSPQRQRRLSPAMVVSALFPMEGTTVLRYEDREVSLVPGMVYFVPPAGAVEFRMEAAFCSAAVGIPGEMLTGAFPDWKRGIGRVLPAYRGAGAMFMDFLSSMLTHGVDLPETELTALSGAITGLAASVLAAAPVEDTNVSRIEEYHINRIRQFISTHLRNPDLDVEFVAQGVGLSQRYVHKLFSANSCHLMQWVWSRRLDACYQEIVLDPQSKRSISEIAYAWGFNDQAHFSHAFRRRFGLSPKEVREIGKAEKTRSAEVPA